MGPTAARIDRAIFDDTFISIELGDVAVDPDVRIEVLTQMLSLLQLSGDRQLLKSRGWPSPEGSVSLSTVVFRQAMVSGVDPDYMLKVARRESGLNPHAAATTSSAAGLYQFIESTWLCALRRYDVAAYRTRGIKFVETGTGACHVDEVGARALALSLRFDPVTSTRIAAALTLENSRAFQSAFGRQPSADELYAMHFLGASKGISFLVAARVSPMASASDLDAQTAKANPGIFYFRDRPKAAFEVINSLSLAGFRGAN